MAQISSIELTDGTKRGIRAGAIPYGIVDSTSTSTAFTATVPGVTELTDGTCVLLKNGVVTSAADFTININGLGAKHAYSNMAAATAETTIFNINYTMLFVYDSTRVSGGGWICYRGYNSNDNTIAYPVGSVYITSTNSAPTVGGTWTLIDKEFTPTTATQISVGTGSSKDFVLNSTNTTSMSAWVSRHGHSITLSVNAITFKVAVSGTNLTLGTFNLSNLGASEATVSPIIIGWSDGAHAIVGMNINRTSGVMQSQDVVVRGTGTSIAAGSSAVFTVELPCDYQYMTDSLCNKFYWRRTA